MGRPVFLACALLLMLTRSGAAGETDFLPDNTEWNGLSELSELARGLELRLELLEDINWSELPAEATLLLLHPTSELNPSDVVLFMQRGGRLLIADDFGSAAPLLELLGIQRLSSSPPRAASYYLDNLQLPIAGADPASHELMRGVSQVMTNHPAAFRSRLPSLAAFGSEEQQLLVAGKVGKGRFVALADPSVLINAMLQFPDNLTMAANLLRHVRPGPQIDRFCLLTGHFRMRGTLSETIGTRQSRAGAQRFLRDYNSFLAQLSDFVPLGHVLQLVAVVAGSLAVLLLVVVLPLPREELVGHWLHPSVHGERSSAQGSAGSRDAAWSAAIFREELEELLTEYVQAPGPVLTLHPQWLVNRVRELAGPEAARTCSALLAALRNVEPAVDATGIQSLIGVRRSELATIYELGRRLLLQLGIKSLPEVSAQAKNHVSDQ